MRRTLGATVAAIPLLLCGCAMVSYMKEAGVWEKAETQLVGMSETRLRDCAGEPMEARQLSDGLEVKYGYVQRFTMASSWCVLTLDIKNGVVSKYTVASANPGGFSSGESTCSLIVDRCVGDGTLEATAIAAPGTVSIERMRGDVNQAMAAAQRQGEQARSAGATAVLSALQQFSDQRQTTKQAQAERAPSASSPVQNTQSQPARQPIVIQSYEPVISIGGAGSGTESRAEQCSSVGSSLASVRANVACRCRTSAVTGAFFKATPDGAACVTGTQFIFGCSISSTGKAQCTQL